MYRVKLSRAYPDRVCRRAVENQLPLLQYACNKIDGKIGLYTIFGYDINPKIIINFLVIKDTLFF